MRVLVIGGSSGREYALLWKLSQSPLVTGLFCVPEKGGRSEFAYLLEPPGKEPDTFVKLAQALKVDLVLCIKKSLLEAGILDMMLEAGIQIFGETRNDLRIENGRIAFKSVCARNSIPTAMPETFYTIEEAAEYAETCALPIMIRAGFLSAGTSAMVARTREEAREIVKTMMSENAFGPAAIARTTFEECFEGTMISLMAVTDGTHIKPITTIKEYRNAWDGGLGMEMDGMGAIAPYPNMSASQVDGVVEKILVPVMNAYKDEGILYKGFLHLILLITDSEIRVVELNTHFGDLQSQIVLSAMESDFVELIEHVQNETLDKFDLRMTHKYTVHLVLASGGYPGRYSTGYRVDGIESADSPGVVIFKNMIKDDGQEYYTTGGRVLSVCAQGETAEEAVSLAYETAAGIKYTDRYMRSDIGIEFVEGMEEKGG